MKVREYIEKFPESERVTFIKQVAVKNEGSPGYHSEYKTTAINTGWEWLRMDSLCEYLVINADHPPIDVTGGWVNHYKNGWLKCAVITTEAELIKHYGEKQGREMVEYYKRTVR